MKDIKVSVIGGGTMGNGIVHCFAQNGFKVSLIEQNMDFAEIALNNIIINLDRQIKKGTVKANDKVNILSRIELLDVIDYKIKDSDLIIEAIYENKKAKFDIYEKLNLYTKIESIVATNTSSISITELSAKYKQTENFIGMHFMNPVPMMQLVELVRGYSTSQETYQKVKEITLALNKVPVEVYDFPGFISNRILMPMINEAIFALMEGVSNKEDIDTIMKLGMNHPMGPLQLADLIGLDVCLNILEVLYEGFNDSKYRPCALLRKMVAANKLGRKTKEGFYKYE